MRCQVNITEHLHFVWFQILQISKMSLMSLNQLFNSPNVVAPICEDSDREVKRAAMQACVPVWKSLRIFRNVAGTQKRTIDYIH